MYIHICTKIWLYWQSCNTWLCTMRWLFTIKAVAMLLQFLATCEPTGINWRWVQISTLGGAETENRTVSRLLSGPECCAQLHDSHGTIWSLTFAPLFLTVLCLKQGACMDSNIGPTIKRYKGVGLRWHCVLGLYLLWDCGWLWKGQRTLSEPHSLTWDLT